MAVNKVNMKILLIYSDDESKLLETLKPSLEENGMQVEVFFIPSREDVGCYAEKMKSAFFKQSEGYLTAPTHILIVSTLTPMWVDFLAGVSCGSDVPFLIFGEAAASSIPDTFRFCFKFFDLEADLRNYLNTEYDIYKKMSSARGVNEARDALLMMGIPVSEAAFAQCVAEGAVKEVFLFLAAGFSPDTRNKEGVPVINIAVRSGSREIFRILFMAGAQLDIQSDDRGTSALIDSVMSTDIDLVRDLIKAGAELDIKSKSGQTALVVAAGAGNIVIAEALLKAGANPDIPDNMGMSARKYAMLFNNSEMLSLFADCPPKESI